MLEPETLSTVPRTHVQWGTHGDPRQMEAPASVRIVEFIHIESDISVDIIVTGPIKIGLLE